MGKFWVGVILSMVFGVVQAQTSNKRVVFSGFEGSKICSKQAELFKGGSRHGKLISNRSTKMYSGPSVICGSIGSLDQSISFVVTGKITSGFGKPWYKVIFKPEDQNQWIPAKYVSLGEAVGEEVGSDSIESLTVTATRGLKVRDCPDSRCAEKTSLRKGGTYTATKKSANNWYFVKAGEQDQGWANAAYLQGSKPHLPVDTQKSSPVKLAPIQEPTSTPKAAIPEPEDPPFDPCSSKVKIKYYKQKAIWLLEEKLTLGRSPHNQCDRRFDLKEGKALIPLGESELYYLVAAVPGSEMETGYLFKSSFAEQYIPIDQLDKETDVFSRDTATYILEHEIYWNSLSFKIKRTWQDFLVWVDTHTDTALSLFAFILGSAMLVTSPLRHRMLRVDQLFIRSGYFMGRSPNFWRMMRKLAFILILSSTLMAALLFYASWLISVASRTQQVMGVGSLVLMSFSVGMFGMRVAGFFTGLLLLFLSLFQFLMFVASLCLLFLLPSLILLLVYYGLYQQDQKKDDAPPATFDRIEIERIHEKVFQLKNFYPETIINWARKDGIKSRWQAFKDVTWAKSTVFDSFFGSVNRNTRTVE